MTALLALIAALISLQFAAAETGPAAPFPAAVEQWRPLITAACDWPPDEALQVVEWESAGDPNAVNPASGAAGLWQILPPFARKHSLDGSDTFDPLLATQAACAEYRADLGRYGFGWWDWEAAVCHWRPDSRAARDEYRCP